MGIRKLANGLWEVSKRWPQGAGRYRRRFESKALAQKVLDRINGAIALGQWRELKLELERGPRETAPTVESFSELYLEEFCKPRMRAMSYRRVADAFLHINARLGAVRLDELRRGDVHEYVERRSWEESTRRAGERVAANTINNEISALTGMLAYAVEKEVLAGHPLAGFRRLKQQERAIRVPSEAQYGKLIHEAEKIDLTVAGFLVALGELGLRKGEGYQMRRHWINWSNQTVTIAGITKSGRVRTVPLSPLAADWLKRLPASIADDHVFWNPRSGAPWKEIRKKFDLAKGRMGLPWLTLHGLRHYRISMWVAAGFDIETVRRWAGHADIQTTQRYMHFGRPAEDAGKEGSGA